MAEEQGPLSPSMHVPLRLLLPGYGGSEYSADRQLAVFTPPQPPPVLLHNSSSGAITTSRFKLPEGWEVEEVPRADASRVDKYYYEPMTGRKFRSLREVERYINEGVYTPRRRRSRTLKLGYHGYHGKKSNFRKMIVLGGQMLRLDEEESNQYHMAIVPATNTIFNSPYKLPDGWVVEEVPRSRGGCIDKIESGLPWNYYRPVFCEPRNSSCIPPCSILHTHFHSPTQSYYYEPGTGRKFRSLLSVDRHLAELNENTTLSEALAELREYNTPLSKAFKIGSHVKNSSSWKTNIPREKVQSTTFNSPPTKINWVIASPGGDSWNPFIGGSLVPESVKQQWSKRFMLSINDRKYEAPNI